MRSSPLSAIDAGSLDRLQDQFRRQPETLDASWRVLFEVPAELDATPRAAGTGARAPRLRYVGRPESPSPAGSFHDEHDSDQQRIIAEAFA